LNGPPFCPRKGLGTVTWSKARGALGGVVRLRLRQHVVEERSAHLPGHGLVLRVLVLGGEAAHHGRRQLENINTLQVDVRWSSTLDVPTCAWWRQQQLTMVRQWHKNADTINLISTSDGGSDKSAVCEGLNGGRSNCAERARTVSLYTRTAI